MVIGKLIGDYLRLISFDWTPGMYSTHAEGGVDRGGNTAAIHHTYKHMVKHITDSNSCRPCQNGAPGTGCVILKTKGIKMNCC